MTKAKNPARPRSKKLTSRQTCRGGIGDRGKRDITYVALVGADHDTGALGHFDGLLRGLALVVEERKRGGRKSPSAGGTTQDSLGTKCAEAKH